MEIKTYLVEGMHCSNCRLHVESGIKNLQGIEDVIVDVSNGQVRISGIRLIDEDIKGAVEQSGYIYRGEIKISPLNSEHWIS
jgi:copper chaperone CopZ